MHRPFRFLALLGSLLAPAAGMAGEPLGEAEIASTFRGMTLDGIYRDGDL